MKRLSAVLAAVFACLLTFAACALAAVPAVITYPTLTTNSPVVGTAEVTTNGTWTGSPTSYAYQWQDCNPGGSTCIRNIAGATSASYTPTSSDLGDTLRAVVYATNADGTAHTAVVTTGNVSNPAGTAPSNTVLPAITGTPQAGQTLTASTGTWTGSPTPTYTYLWSNGATGSTDLLTSGDVGNNITVAVTATNTVGNATATSSSVGPVTAAPTPPANTVLPAISGTAQQGQTLTASTGTWTGTAPITYTYLWSDGTTTSTDLLTSADVGISVSVTVTGTNSVGNSSATSSSVGPVTASGAYTCTQHVTTSTFAAAFSSAGAGAVLCLAAGSYGSFSGSSKTSMVVITPDPSAGGTAPTGNATGNVDGNVKFTGFNFAPAANITMDGITFTGDTAISGSSHDLLLHDSLFHQHLVITDTSMNNANVTADYSMFPGNTADCINGPEGRIWLNETSHGTTPDGVTIENSNIGGTASQCDGIQTGGYGPRYLGNWIHDFHYANSAHTDGIQDYGGRFEVVKGNLMYNVADCYVSYDGTNHADVENNVCVNDGTQSNGASPNDLDILADSGSTIKHNTIAAFKDAYNNPGGCITLGSKGAASSGTVITDNMSTCLVTNSGGHSATYSENHNLWVSSGPSGSGDLHGAPTYQGGACGSLSSSQPPFCSDSWSNYLLTSGSAGHAAADDGTDMGAYGPGPVTPGE